MNVGSDSSSRRHGMRWMMGFGVKESGFDGKEKPKCVEAIYTYSCA